jgi:uncharacterized protein YjdB
MIFCAPESPLGSMNRRRTAGLIVSLSLLAAAFAGVLSGCGSANSTTTTPQKILKTIALTPATASLSVGATQQFKAIATYTDGSTADLTSSVSWVTANTTIAGVNSSGMLTAAAAGSTTVTASTGGFSGSASVTVAATTATLSSISIAPATASVAVGSTQQFTATGNYSDGSTADLTQQVTWSSSASSVATINAIGVAKGVAAGSATITAALNGASATASLAVTASTATLSSIAVTPSDPSITSGNTEQFTATATYSDGSTANVTSQVSWKSSDTAVATIDASGLATGAAAGSTTITASLNGVSGTTTLTVTASTGGGGSGSVNIATWHVDNNRSGLNSSETTLTPGNVNASSFGKLFSIAVDGYAYAEPLIMSNVTINGGTHNVLYVATEHDDVYAFDSDTGTQLWHVSLLQANETPLTNGAIKPFQGITSTPVIDPSTGTMWVVSAQTNTTTGASTFRLHALDITNGGEKFEGPATITASVSGTNPSGNGSTLTLTTACVQRSALLFANENIYIGFGGCPTGWLLSYSALNLKQEAVWNASPDQGGVGPYASAGGIWMGSGGPVADSDGDVYIVTGNGPWDGNNAMGDSVIKFLPTLKIVDSFTPDAYEFMDCDDADFAAGGLMMIPGTTDMVAGGKIGRVYLLNSGNLGGEQANDVGAWDRVWFENDLAPSYTSQPCTYMPSDPTGQISPYEIFGTSAYFNGYVYLGITPTSSTAVAPVRQFAFNSSNNTLTPGAYTSPSQPENTRGTTPFISSNGNADGIVWMINEGIPLQQGTPTAATLYAYDAQNFPNQLYSSSTNSADTAGYGIKFTSPVVANGKVYISTGHDPVTASNPDGEIDVYGLK